MTAIEGGADDGVRRDGTDGARRGNRSVRPSTGGRERRHRPRCRRRLRGARRRHGPPAGDPSACRRRCPRPSGSADDSFVAGDPPGRWVRWSRSVGSRRSRRDGTGNHAAPAGHPPDRVASRNRGSVGALRGACAGSVPMVPGPDRRRHRPRVPRRARDGGDTGVGTTALLLATLATIVARDAAENAVSVGGQIGVQRGARTVRAELAHVGSPRASARAPSRPCSGWPVSASTASRSARSSRSSSAAWFWSSAPTDSPRSPVGRRWGCSRNAQARSCGTGMSERISSTISVVETPETRASGVTTIRWDSAGGAIAFTSSGVA